MFITWIEKERFSAFVGDKVFVSVEKIEVVILCGISMCEKDRGVPILLK
jgi:hypothetical protein